MRSVAQPRARKLTVPLDGVAIRIPEGRMIDPARQATAEPASPGRAWRRPAAFIALLAGGGVAAIGAALLVLWPLSTDEAFVVDSLQQLTAISAAALALAIASGSGSPARRRLRAGVAIGLAVTAIGIVAWNLEPGGSTTASPIADVTFIVGAAIALAVVEPALFGGLSRPTIIAVGLDSAILFAVAATAVLAVWLNEDRATRTDSELIALFAGAAVVAGSSAGVIALVAKRIRPFPGGAWATIAGLILVAVAWIAWLGMETEQAVSGATPAGFLFSLGVLLLAYGCLTWDDRPRETPIYERWARAAGDALPIGAALLAVGFFATGMTRFQWVAVGAGSAILFAIARQALLLRSERQAREDEHLAARRLEDVVRERSDTIIALSRLEPGSTPEATARIICREALRLDGIDQVIVSAFTPAGDVVALAAEGIDLDVVGRPLPPDRAAVILERAGSGPWVQLFDERSNDPYFRDVHAAGVRGMVNAGLRWNERHVGSLGLGTRSPTVAAGLGGRLSTVREFAVVAAALLGPALAERDHATCAREAIQATIDGDRFQPVYQPVVELATGRLVGFESLTQFDDATRPDLLFLEAAAAGMAIPLETATLRASLAGAASLPAAGWLSINVSPAMAVALHPLIELLGGAGRDVVVEITEHVAIEDYPRLVNALGTLRRFVRIAVDDAGAGFAGLRHILELRPQFVKLDLALVRAIDTDPGRRALVASMASFARETGSTLIAEGIESRGQLVALQDLGVELGQGFLLGRPAPAGAFATVPVHTTDAVPALRPIGPALAYDSIP